MSQRPTTNRKTNPTNPVPKSAQSPQTRVRTPEGAPSLSRSLRQDGDVDLHSNSPKREAQNQPAESRKPSPVSPCAPCGESVKPDPEFAARAARVKSNIRKILLTSPSFPRLYADVVLHYAPNSSEAKILRSHYQKICEKVNGRQCGDSRPRLSRSRSDRA